STRSPYTTLFRSVDGHAAAGLTPETLAALAGVEAGVEVVGALGLVALFRQLRGILTEAQLADLRHARVAALLVEGARRAASEVVERTLGTVEVHELPVDLTAAEAVAAVGDQRLADVEAHLHLHWITAHQVGVVRAADLGPGVLRVA